jgi:hypothetical protein
VPYARHDGAALVPRLCELQTAQNRDGFVWKVGGRPHEPAAV